MLAEEALAVGDAKFAGKSRARMEEFKAQGETIVSVRTWCHEALWLHGGVARALGPFPAVVD